MHAPTDFAHAAAVERILRAHGMASTQSGSGDRTSRTATARCGGTGRRRRWGRRTCGPCARSPGVLRGTQPFSKRSDGPDGDRPARRVSGPESIGRERRRVDDRRLAGVELGDQPAGDGAERHAGALVPGGQPQPGDGARTARWREGDRAATGAAPPTPHRGAARPGPA